jgi:signal peptidase I
MKTKSIENRPRSPDNLGGKEPTSSLGLQDGVLKDLLTLLLNVGVIAGVIALLFVFIFGVSRLSDDSMSPALENGDLAFYYRLDKDYVVNNTLVYEYKGEKQVRRVVAVEGDTIDIKNNSLYINGSRQQEPWIYTDTLRYDTNVDFPMKLGKDEVFVLGDNRKVGADSRVYGALNIKDTLGKVMIVLRRRGI